jgi:hypothetical protein
MVGVNLLRKSFEPLISHRMRGAPGLISVPTGQQTGDALTTRGLVQAR